jgi:hypothetical protein
LYPTAVSTQVSRLNGHHAFVAVNYTPKLGDFGDDWIDFADVNGNTLNIGKLQFETKHGKKPKSFTKKVHPTDVKSALCLVVNLFLEQTKVTNEDSLIHNSVIKVIKATAATEDIHANSIGKVSVFATFGIWNLYVFVHYMNSLNQHQISLVLLLCQGQYNLCMVCC